MGAEICRDPELARAGAVPAILGERPPSSCVICALSRAYREECPPSSVHLAE